MDLDVHDMPCKGPVCRNCFKKPPHTGHGFESRPSVAVNPLHVFFAGEQTALNAAAEQALAEALGGAGLQDAVLEAIAETLERNPVEQQLMWQPGLCGFSLLPLDLFPGLPSEEWVAGRPCLVSSLFLRLFLGGEGLYPCKVRREARSLPVLLPSDLSFGLPSESGPPAVPAWYWPLVSNCVLEVATGLAVQVYLLISVGGWDDAILSI
jgi:hypothetical protein